MFAFVIWTKWNKNENNRMIIFCEIETQKILQKTQKLSNFKNMENLKKMMTKNVLELCLLSKKHISHKFNCK